MPPLQRQGGILKLLGGGEQGLAGGVEAQPLRQPAEQRGPAERRLERGEPPSDRRLAQTEGATGSPQRTTTRDGEKDASVIPVDRGAAVGIRHDTETYRRVSILSITEIIMWRYDPRNRGRTLSGHIGLNIDDPRTGRRKPVRCGGRQWSRYSISRRRSRKCRC